MTSVSLRFPRARTLCRFGAFGKKLAAGGAAV